MVGILVDVLPSRQLYTCKLQTNHFNQDRETRASPHDLGSKLEKILLLQTNFDIKQIRNTI